MLFIKRAATAFVLFVFLFVVLYFGICIGGGVIAGIRVGMANPNDPNLQAMGRQAGGDFVRNNLAVISLSAFAGAMVGSLSLSFTGLLPWCRKPKPPQLPPM